MKKAIVSLGVALAFLPMVAFADVSTSTVMTSQMSSGGYMDACYYIGAFSSSTCPYYDTALNQMFATDPSFREPIIDQWRFVTFHGHYNQSN